MKSILEKIMHYASTLYSTIINLYIFTFNRCLKVGECLILKLYGESMLDDIMFRWYTAVNFYTSLWYVSKKQLLDTVDTLKLTLIWKIKRSSNFLVKKLYNYLTKYDWFNNNIIKF